VKGSDLVEIPKEPNEVLRHPKDLYHRNRVLRLNGPDGVERQYLLVQELDRAGRSCVTRTGPR
jgi:hypothetical protein